MRFVGPSRTRKHYGLYECSCGRSFETYIYNVRSGHTRSCGCLTKSKCRSRTRVYKAWQNMKTRCTNRNTASFGAYGGRGIQVCRRWLDYENFLADMGLPLLGQSLDRINVDGNYEPANCRWADAETQQNNRREHIRPLGDLTLSQEARSRGIRPNTALYRLMRGWSPEDALSRPSQRAQNSIPARAKAVGLKPNTVICRLRRGWTLERALCPVSQNARRREAKKHLTGDNRG